MRNRYADHVDVPTPPKDLSLSKSRNSVAPLPEQSSMNKQSTHDENA